jgi:large subunit ribosomal protein L22
MSTYRYSQKLYDDTMARALGRDIDISFKQSIEITRTIRKMEISKAKAYLQRVIDKKQPQAFHRFTNGLGHKPGIAAGRYPIRASKAILSLVKEAETNAQTRGLGTCIIIHASAQKARRPMHYGRHPRLRMKRTHVEIVVKETESKKEDKKEPKKKGAQ